MRTVSRMALRSPCSRSETASARRGCARASTSPRSSRARRSAASTCARSRTSTSTSCPATTYIKGFLRTYADYLGLDGSSTWTSTTRASSSARRTPPLRTRRVPPAAERHGGAGSSRGVVLLALTAIVLVTALVIVAWKFGGAGSDVGAGLQHGGRRPGGAAGGAKPSPRPRTGPARAASCSASRATRAWRCAPDRAPGRRSTAARSSAARRSASPEEALVAFGDPENVSVKVNGSQMRLPAAVRRPSSSRRRGCPRGHRALDADPRAAIVVTGSELVRGERTDLNGPFLAQEALLARARAGADRDRRRPARGARGGAARRRSPPTSASCPAGSGRRTTTAPSSSSRASPGASWPSTRSWRRRSKRISRTFAERMRPPVRATSRAGVTQAGDAARRRARRSGSRAPRPGSSLDTGDVRRRRPAGPARRAAAALAARRSRASRCGASSRGTTPPRRRVLRFFGASESAVAQALADAGGDGDGVEATICARDFEIHVDLVVEPGAEARADALERRSREPLERYLFGRGRAADRGDRARPLPRRAGSTLATAESCTGGLVAGAADVGARARATSSAAAIVAYADERQDTRSSASRAALLERARRRLGGGRGGDGARAPASGSARTSPSR